MSNQESETVEIFGKELSCLICNHQKFWKKEVQLNTKIATLFNLAWANKSAICVICENCGYIHWFHPSK